MIAEEKKCPACGNKNEKWENILPIFTNMDAFSESREK